MKRICFLLAAALLGASSLMGLDRHQSRHMGELEFLAPLGTHTLGELFGTLSELNKDGRSKFPKVWDERKVTLRSGDRNWGFLISAEELLFQLETQVSEFHVDYQMEISRNSFCFHRLDNRGHVLSDADAVEFWKKELPRVKEKVLIPKGEEKKLASAFYEEEVLILGKAELEGGPAFFQDLKIQGSLEVFSRKIQGDTLSSEGNFGMGEDAFAKFNKISADGDLRLDKGANLKTKALQLKENGRVVLDEDSNLILD